jgi:hypothetical protein
MDEIGKFLSTWAQSAVDCHRAANPALAAPAKKT